jgi:hypothetical protein
MSVTKLRIVTVLLLAMGLISVAWGVLTDERVTGEEPGASRLGFPVAEKTAEQPKPAHDERVHTDLHGDPLPPTALARLGTVRFRPVSRVDSLAFAPDGQTLATAGYRVCLCKTAEVTGSAAPSVNDAIAPGLPGAMGVSPSAHRRLSAASAIASAR